MTRDIVEAAKAWVPEVKEAGADIIIALSHSGIDANQTDLMENASLFLGDVDGHRRDFHRPPAPGVPGRATVRQPRGRRQRQGHAMGKPAVMGGFWGSHMGLIDLLLERDGNGWRVVSAESEARPIYERKDGKVVALVKDETEVVDAVKADHEATLAYVRRAVGKTSAPLFSYFALVADDPSVQIVSQAQTWYIKQMMEGTQWEGLPILSAAAPFKAGGRGGAGLLHRRAGRRHRHQERRRPLPLSEHRARGADQRRPGARNGWRCRPASSTRSSRARPTSRCSTIAFPSYNFDVIDGVTYKIDLSQPPKYDPKGGVINPARSRIVDLAYQRQADRPGAEVRGRHQQLSRRRRRQLPRHQRQGDHLRRRRTPTAT